MIKCLTCKNHIQDGAKHTCTHCENKTTYGKLYEPFLEGCSFYDMTEKEKRRQALNAELRRLPIDR